MPEAGVPERFPLVAKVTPEGRPPTSVKVIGATPPVAVTGKVPGVFSANVVDDADVNDGDPVTTTLADFAEAVPAPLALIACTAKVYVEPAVRPVTVSVVAVLLNVWAVCAVVPMYGVTT